MKIKVWISIGIFLVSLVLIINLTIFNNYEKHLVALQESNLLTIVKLVAEHLESYYTDNLEKINVQFDLPVFKEDVEAYYTLSESFKSIMVVKKDGSIAYKSGIWEEIKASEIINQIEQKKFEERAILYPPILVKPNQYVQLIAKQIVYENEQMCYLLALQDMQEVYRKIVEPVKIRNSGYSMVKSFEGNILMYQDKGQIGLNSVEGRKQKYKNKDLDFNDLERLMVEQRTNLEGSRILTSYWWYESNLPPSKKIVAYTQLPIGEETWIVNATLDFNEISGPLEQTQFLVILISVIILCMFAVVLVGILNTINRDHARTREMEHLQELNKALIEIRKKQEQLIHGNKIQTMGMLTGMVAHEFNNFLTPIILYGELLLQDSSISQENLRCIQDMIDSATKAGELTHEIALYGRREKGELKKGAIKVREQVKKSLKVIKKTLPTTIELIEDLEAIDNYSVIANKSTINQIIVNLCTNAIHAIKPLGGTLSIKGRATTHNGQRSYVLTVQDTGMGMDADLLKHIFTPFYTTKESGVGTGLGLSVVKDLVKQAGGEIKVESEEGRGSCFTIIFPLTKDEKQTDKQNILVERQSKFKLLIVEDKKTLSKAFEKSLSSLYKKVEVYNNPSEALAKIKQDMEAFDAVITDYAMPLMNGCEFASILRNLGFSKKIILLSGYIEDGVSWYVDNGIIDEVLEKPIFLEALQDAINS